MTRFEIFAHEALETPLMEALCPIPEGTDTVEGKVGRPFTMVHHVAGRGSSGSSLGNEIWPETNIQLILFVDEAASDAILQGIADVRAKFPQLGLAAFCTRGVEAV